MASTAPGTNLTEQHRLRQLALRAIVLQQVLKIWPAFDIKAIDETWPQVEAALLALIGQRRDQSAILSAAYYVAFRAAEGVTGALPPPPAPVDETARIAASLGIVGPIMAKSLVLQNRPDAAAVTLVRVSGAVARHVLDGGRARLLDAVQKDTKAVGWARVTSRKPCAFCMMLASRGPVYKSQTSSGFRSHDHCACASEPVFRRGQPWPGRSREFQQQWNEATQGVASKDALNVFRQAVEET